MKRIFLIAAILFLSFQTVNATPVLLKTISVQKFSNHCHFTFHLAKPARYRIFTLNNPSRVVLDLENVYVKKTFFYKPSISCMFVTNIRYAAHHEHVFRMVFETEKSVRTQVKKMFSDNSTDHLLQMNFTQSAQIKAARSEKLIKENKPVYQKKLADVMIVIDPGHGGKDPGAIGRNGAREKDVVLSISRLLQAEINRQKGFHAALTRTGDYYLPLRARLAIARKYHADMFVAIHADTWKNKEAKGVSVFALSQRGATSEAARWLATRENQSELMGGVELQDKSHLLKSILINLSQSATIRASLEIGQAVLRSVRDKTSLHHRIVEQAAFVVLKSPDIPSLLIETGFLSNRFEENRLRSRSYQQQIAHAMMNGMRSYFLLNPPRYSWLSYWREHR